MPSSVERVYHEKRNLSFLLNERTKGIDEKLLAKYKEPGARSGKEDFRYYIRRNTQTEYTCIHCIANKCIRKGQYVV